MIDISGKSIVDIKIGDTAQFSKTISESDIYQYAGLTGDFNYLYVDAVQAAKGLFKERIANGMLTSGLISAVLGTQLPGQGTICLSHNLEFLAPTKIGDTVTARVEVMERDLDRNRIVLRTTITNQQGKVVVDGTAVVKPPKVN